MSELDDHFEETIRGLPCDDQYRTEHLNKVCSLAMLEFDNTGRATTGSIRSRSRFARRHAMGIAVAALLLASVSFGVLAYLGQSRQAEPLRRPVIAQTELDRLETQLIASLRTVEEISPDQSSAAHDRAVDACWTWHLSRAAEVP